MNGQEDHASYARFATRDALLGDVLQRARHHATVAGPASWAAYYVQLAAIVSREREAYDAGRLAGYEEGTETVDRLRTALETVLPRLDHWPKEALGVGWRRETEQHSDQCPPCNLRAVLLSLAADVAS